MVYAAGCLLLAKNTKKLCFQLRSDMTKKNPSTWSFWGGKSENFERTIDTIKREISEETNLDMSHILKFYPLHKYVSKDNQFEYQAYITLIDNEFVPILNHESGGYAWVTNGIYPRPLHFGTKAILFNTRVNKKIKTIIDSI